ncbi:MAG: CocE/NonD family hydrolase [Holophagaceae bacterium]
MSVRRWYLIILVTLSLFAQNPVQSTTLVQDRYTKLEQYVTMRDGIRLFTSIYIPKDNSQKHPILLLRTPYSVAPYGLDSYRASVGPSRSFDGEDYIYVYQDVRGRWKSEGIFVDMNPVKLKKGPKDTDETTDTYDTIDWLIKNIPRNNGRVGMWGISWPGHMVAQGMISHHPALKAVSPQAPMIDLWEGDDAYHLGAFQLAANFGFFTRFGGYRPEPISEAPKPILIDNPDGYDFYLKKSNLSNLSKVLGNQAIYWDAYISHDAFDTYWQARNLRPHLLDIKPAVLTVGGWFDAEDLFGPLATFKTINKQSPSTNNRLVMGPWTHGQWARGDGSRVGSAVFDANTSLFFQKEIELPFFNHFLKNKGAMNLAKATVFETGSNQWRFFDAWPPKEAVQSAIYFQPKGGLAFEPVKVQSGILPSEWISDPAKPVPYTMDITFGYSRTYMTEDQRFASSRTDVLVFETEPLESDLTIAGPLKVHLFASTSGTDSDFTVKVIDVFPNNAPTPADSPKNWNAGGYQMLVRGDTLRGKYRNSYSRPEPFVPNEITEVPFILQDIFHTFKKGHRLMVHVQSSWFPIVDRNPQVFMTIKDAKPEDFQKATQRIFHSPRHMSRIEFLQIKN